MQTPIQKVERWSVDALHDHPDQQTLVGDVSDFELQELAGSIERDGLREPIHILPCGTIVAGHQRLRAVRILGFDDVDVVVRHDLAAAGDAEVQRLLIEDNFYRRQMGPLEIGRACRALKRLERSGRSVFTKADREAVRDRIAARLGGTVSGRTLDRYERLLDLPREVQDAISRGELPMGMAARLFTLTVAKQKEVARKIRDGMPAKEVARLACSSTEVVADRAPQVFAKTLKFLRQNLATLESSVCSVAGSEEFPDDAFDLLERAATVFEGLLDQASL